MEVIESIVTDSIEVEESTTTISTLETEKSKTGEIEVGNAAVCALAQKKRLQSRRTYDELDA